MKPLPWSFTALEDFVNCPWSFHETRVTKRIKKDQNEHAIWGEFVHKAFEDRLADGVVLPDTLTEHEPYMERLEAMPGKGYTERKIAFDKLGRPCEFFDKDVWYRGVIDYSKIHGDTATLVDYKTGKVHSKYRQLKLFALHTFAMYPEVRTIDVRFYWTKALYQTGEQYKRGQIPLLWQDFLGDLKQYKQAFQEDVWQARPSGLCHGWCPVTDCSHWKPKRKK